MEAEKWADSIYHAYASLVNSAKALLLTRDKQANSQAGIIALFDEVFEAEPDLLPEGGFAALVYQIQQNKPSESFATRYLLEAKSFLGRVREHRNRQLSPSESIAL